MSLSSNLYDMFFEWPSTDAQEVIVTGSFDDWSKSKLLNKTARGFVGTVKVPYGKDVVYKFLVDDEWQVLRTQPVTVDGDGAENNIFKVPQAKAKAAPAGRIPMVFLPLNCTEHTTVGATPIDHPPDFSLPPAQSAAAGNSSPAAQDAPVVEPVEEPKPAAATRATVKFVALNTKEHNTIGSGPADHPPDFVLPPSRRARAAAETERTSRSKTRGGRAKRSRSEGMASRFVVLNSTEHNTVGAGPAHHPPDYVLPASPRARAQAGGSGTITPLTVEDELPHGFVRLNCMEHNTVGHRHIEHPPDYVLPASPRARAQAGGSGTITPLTVEDELPHGFVRLNCMEHNTVGHRHIEHPADYVLPASPRARAQAGGSGTITPLTVEDDLPHGFVRLNCMEHNTVGRRRIEHPPDYVLPPSPRSRSLGRVSGRRALRPKIAREAPVASTSRLASVFVPLNSTEHNTVGAGSVAHPPDFVLPPSPRSFGKAAARSLSAEFAAASEFGARPSPARAVGLKMALLPLNSTEHNTVKPTSAAQPLDFVLPPSPRSLGKAAAKSPRDAPPATNGAPAKSGARPSPAQAVGLKMALLPLNSTEHNTVRPTSPEQPPDFVLPPSPRSLGKAAAKSPRDEAPAINGAPAASVAAAELGARPSPAQAVGLKMALLPLNSTEHNTVRPTSPEQPPDFVLPPSPRSLGKKSGATAFPLLSPKPTAAPAPAPAVNGSAAPPAAEQTQAEEPAAPNGAAQMNGTARSIGGSSKAASTAPSSTKKAKLAVAPGASPASKALVLFRPLFSSAPPAKTVKKKRTNSIIGRVRTIFRDKDAKEAPGSALKGQS